MRESLRSGAVAGALLVDLGLFAWVTGLPALFPSLGPSAYVLATRPGAPESAPRRVIGGHALGALAGLLAYRALAPGELAIAAHGSFSPAVAALAASAVVAVALTTAAMLATDLRHAPACATTLIVALGLLATPVEVSVLVVAVVVLVGTALAAARAGLAG